MSIFRIFACFGTALLVAGGGTAFGQDASPFQNDAEITRDKNGKPVFDVRVSEEAARALRQAIREKSPNEAAAEKPVPATPIEPAQVEDTEAARKARINAQIRRECMEIPERATVTVPSGSIELFKDICADRQFEYKEALLQTEWIKLYMLPKTAKQSAVQTAQNRLAQCRAAAAKRITYCETKTVYCGGSLPCEEVTCDTVHSSCNDSWSTGPTSFYCDTENTWNRNFRYETVLAKACPVG